MPPIEPIKEVAKVAGESVGTIASIWQWIIGAIGTGLFGLWGHITGRLKRIEDSMVTASLLKEHIDEENEKFKTLFTKHDGLIEKIGTIAADVAHIKGMLDK